MARARNIKPGFFSNEDIAELSFGSRLLFIGLWTLSDREGRLEDRPKRIRGELFRFDDVSTETLSEWLDVLANKGFIVRYCVGKENYIQITNFVKHQNPHKKEQASSIPGPSEIVASPVITGQDREKPDHAGLIPSSLIPDSGFSDSPNSDSVTEPAPRVVPFTARRKPEEPKEWEHTQEFRECWNRHKKNRHTESFALVAQMLITRANVRWDLIKEKHSTYCAYWKKTGWQFCPLTFLEWIDNEMPDPPDKAEEQRNGWRSSPDIPNYPAAVLPGPDVGVSIAPMKIIRKGHAK